MIPSPYRITDEDLAGADGKTRTALAPVLDALNVTINDVVSILTGGVGGDNLADEVKSLEFSYDSGFPLIFKTTVKRPRFVSMACTPKDGAHSLAIPFVMQGFAVTEQGNISIPFITGTIAGQAYALTFWIRA